METIAGAGSLVVFIISFVLAVFVVNKLQQIYMKLMGADMMYYSAKKKLIAIFVVGVVIASLILGFFSAIFGS